MKQGVLFLSLFVCQVLFAGEAPFKDKETLHFRFYYGLLTAGRGTFKTEAATCNKKDVFHTKFEVYTVGMVDKVTRVRDVFESYYDRKTQMPEKAVISIEEGKINYNDSVSYFHKAGYLVSDRGGRVEVPQNTMDILSIVFHARTYDWNEYQVNDTVSIPVYYKEKLFPLRIVYKGKEKIKTELGTFNCFRLIPVTEPGQIFKSDEKLNLWLSDDDNRVPIRLALDLLIGAIKFDLQKHENLKYPLAAKIK